MTDRQLIVLALAAFAVYSVTRPKPSAEAKVEQTPVPTTPQEIAAAQSVYANLTTPANIVAAPEVNGGTRTGMPA